MNARSLTLLRGCPLLAVAAVLAVSAAPMIPRTSELSDEARSLAGLLAVDVSMLPLPRMLADRAVNGERLERRFRELLAEGGLEARDDGRPPRVVLRVEAAADGDHPDTIAVLLIIAVHQGVTVERLGEHLTVPTASMSAMKLARESEAQETLEALLRKNLGALARVVREASR